MAGFLKNWQSERTKRKEAKWNAFNTAYAQGMDPRASAFEAVSDVTHEAAGLAGKIGGGNILGNLPLGGKGDANRPQSPTKPDQPGDGGNGLLIIGVIVVGLLAFGKKLFR